MPIDPTAGCCGSCCGGKKKKATPKVDSIDFYTRELEDIREQIHFVRRSPFRRTNTGFVVMKTLTAAAEGTLCLDVHS